MGQSLQSENRSRVPNYLTTDSCDRHRCTVLTNLLSIQVLYQYLKGRLTMPQPTQAEIFIKTLAKNAG